MCRQQQVLRVDHVSWGEEMLDLARSRAKNCLFAKSTCDRLYERVADAATNATTSATAAANTTTYTVYRTVPLNRRLLIQWRVPGQRYVLL
jgi:hypothetical protein